MFLFWIQSTCIVDSRYRDTISLICAAVFFCLFGGLQQYFTFLWKRIRNLNINFQSLPMGIRYGLQRLIPWKRAPGSGLEVINSCITLTGIAVSRSIFMHIRVERKLSVGHIRYIILSSLWVSQVTYFYKLGFVVVRRPLTSSSQEQLCQYLPNWYVASVG